MPSRSCTARPRSLLCGSYREFITRTPAIRWEQELGVKEQFPSTNAQADGELLKFWDRGRVRGGAIFRSDSNMIWVVQSSCKKYIAFAVGQISSTSLRHPNPARGADRDRHERGMGCGGRGSVGAQGDRRADR